MNIILVIDYMLFTHEENFNVNSSMKQQTLFTTLNPAGGVYYAINLKVSMSI